MGLKTTWTTLCTFVNVHDSRTLLPMLDNIKCLGFDFSGRIFNADGSHDKECIFEDIFWSGILPNIKQRKGGAANHNTSKRKEAVERFSPA